VKGTAHLIFDPSAGPGYSPYRVLDGQGHSIRPINDFLDAQALRNLSPRSLRTYAFDLLNFARWWVEENQPSWRRLAETRLSDYVRYQLAAQPARTPNTVNHRLTALRCLYRFHVSRDIPGSLRGPYRRGKPFRWTRPSRTTLKLKAPRRVVVPLSPDEVLQFWQSFRSYRDVSLVALMLANGLRSRELLTLHCADVVPLQACIRVTGKGNRQRVLPLSHDCLLALNRYLDLERPRSETPYLFVSLKGARRGQPMTPAGLRSLFRHHRKQTGISRANPHRFRHTFGADMVRAGVALPALMHLMGHASIQTTLLYTELSCEDVWAQYRRAVQKLLYPVVTPTP